MGYCGRRNEEPPPPLVGAQGYQWFPLYKPVVDKNIDVDAVLPYMAFIPTSFLPSRLIQHVLYLPIFKGGMCFKQ